MKATQFARLAIITTAALSMAPPFAAGQAAPQDPKPGRMQGDAHHSAYDSATLVTLTGTVQQVLLKPGRNGATGLHLLLATQEGTREVAVGPTFYLFAEGLEVDQGDEVTVTGSAVAAAGSVLILANAITHGTLSLVLRDDHGRPVWRGKGPGTRGGQ